RTNRGRCPCQRGSPMSQVICQGCGQAFDVPEGYGRNKIQCPGCGVICAVPEGGGPAPARRARPATAPAREVEAEAPAPPAAIPVAAPAAADPWGQPAVPLAPDGLLPPQEGERGD